jgi:uncharacterized protein YegL
MNSTLPPAPTGPIVRRELQFFWLADHSGSMGGPKIAALNQAIREAIPEIRKALVSHPEVQIMMRAIRFSSSAAWHVGPSSVSLDQFVWHDLDADSTTATDAAIKLLMTELDVQKMPARGYPPVCILISDGCCDNAADYERAISALKSIPWGLKAVRLAIGIRDRSGSGYSESELLKFVSHPEVGVLDADSPEKLTQYIKLASVAASVGASVGRSKAGTTADQHVVLPPIKTMVAPTSSTDLF